MACTSRLPPIEDTKGPLCFVGAEELRGIRDTLMHSKDAEDRKAMYFIVNEFFMGLPKNHFLPVKNEETLTILMGAFDRAQLLTGGLQKWPFYSTALKEISQANVKRFIRAYTETNSEEDVTDDVGKAATTSAKGGSVILVGSSNEDDGMAVSWDVVSAAKDKAFVENRNPNLGGEVSSIVGNSSFSTEGVESSPSFATPPMGHQAAANSATTSHAGSNALLAEVEANTVIQENGNPSRASVQPSAQMQSFNNSSPTTMKFEDYIPNPFQDGPFQGTRKRAKSQLAEHDQVVEDIGGEPLSSPSIQTPFTTPQSLPVQLPESVTKGPNAAGAHRQRFAVFNTGPSSGSLSEIQDFDSTGVDSPTETPGKRPARQAAKVATVATEAILKRTGKPRGRGKRKADELAQGEVEPHQQAEVEKEKSTPVKKLRGKNAKTAKMLATKQRNAAARKAREEQLRQEELDAGAAEEGNISLVLQTAATSTVDTEMGDALQIPDAAEHDIQHSSDTGGQVDVVSENQIAATLKEKEVTLASTSDLVPHTNPAVPTPSAGTLSAITAPPTIPSTPTPTAPITTTTPLNPTVQLIARVQTPTGKAVDIPVTNDTNMEDVNLYAEWKASEDGMDLSFEQFGRMRRFLGGKGGK